MQPNYQQQHGGQLQMAQPKIIIQAGDTLNPSASIFQPQQPYPKREKKILQIFNEDGSQVNLQDLKKKVTSLKDNPSIEVFLLY